MSQWKREIPSVRKQYLLLKNIWGKWIEPGYVFLPWIPGDLACSPDKEVRRRGFKNGPAFDWPPSDNGKAILAHLEKHKDDDIYFTPATFALPERKAEAIGLTRALWADLDEVNPEALELTPTIAWQSSPGRYQAVWLFNEAIPNATEPGGLNQRLTYEIGADSSGWDATQLLRVPGSKNHKPAFGVEGVQGYVLFEEIPRPNTEEFRNIPEVPKDHVPLKYEALAELVGRQNLAELKKKIIRNRVPRAARELLWAKDAGEDRSGKVWNIARSLADCGFEIEEIVYLLQHSVWNKYEGRDDELKQLQTAAHKAILRRGDEADSDSMAIVSDEWKEWQDWKAWMTKEIPELEWLIPNFWVKGGLGFIAGIPKSYKSWFGLHMALAIATGGEFLGETANQARVLYIQEEDSENTVRLRLVENMEHLWDDGSTPTIQMRIQSGFLADDVDWQNTLEEFVEEHKVEFVLIDTLMKVAGDTDTERASELRKNILNPLGDLARKHNLAVCFIHHNTKSGGAAFKPGEMSVTRASTRMMGSGQLHAWADCGLYIRDKQGDHVIIEVENKQQEDRVIKVRILPQRKNENEGFIWNPRIEVVHEADKSDVQPIQKKTYQTRKEPIIVGRLRKLGATESRKVKTPQQLAEVFDLKAHNVRNQLEHAYDGGYVQKMGEGYYVVQ